MISSNILAGLNPQQLEAVTLSQGCALILAGAGSGKTRVLTTRIAWLVQTGQVGPYGILAVTFTNKAAREMLTRVAAMLPINTRGMWVGTFHGLCNRMLRVHHRDAGLPQTFQILDSQDQMAAIKRLLKSLEVDEERYSPRDLQYFVNAKKEAGMRASAVEAGDDWSRRMTQLYAEYDQQCNREGAVDFAELLLRCYELLSRNEALRNHYQQRFAHILVDEFQDTNRLQYRWLQLLAGSHNAIFAVGDDDQSIYTFRGASPQNMFDFERHFARGKVIKLEENYRSQGNILDAANALISHNSKRLGKRLWTQAPEGSLLSVHEALTDVDEAAFIVEQIRSLRSDGTRPSDIAVLYRANSQSRVLEHALFNAGLPYRVYGGLRFFERQEIKHALAYLRLVANSEDDGAFLRVINIPARGIGSRSLEQLQQISRLRGVSLWQAACSKPLSGKGAQGLASFVQLIEELARDCRELSLPDTAERVIDRSGLKDYYAGDKDGRDRVENLEELINAAAGFDPDESLLGSEQAGDTIGSGAPDAASVALERDANFMLSAFLAHAALEAGEHQAAAGADALQLMTVHAAKGLEFDAVFISGLEEGLFPHENSLTEGDGVEEERRLMYVAITRARRRLFLTHAQTRMLHGQTRYNIASRFLDEVPARLMRYVGGRAPLRLATGQHPAAAVTLSAHTAPSPISPWRIGQDVIHPKFGPGVIVSVLGGGDDARVEVNFRQVGRKELVLAYARLSPA